MSQDLAIQCQYCIKWSHAYPIWLYLFFSVFFFLLFFFCCPILIVYVIYPWTIHPVIAWYLELWSKLNSPVFNIPSKKLCKTVKTLNLKNNWGFGKWSWWLPQMDDWMSIHGFKVIVYVYGNIILPARRIYYLFTTTTIPLTHP